MLIFKRTIYPIHSIFNMWEQSMHQRMKLIVLIAFAFILCNVSCIKLEKRSLVASGRLHQRVLGVQSSQSLLIGQTSDNQLETRKGHPVQSIRNARLNLIGCSIVYGSNYVASKALLKTIPPDLLNVFRFIIPVCALLPSIVSLPDWKRPIRVGLELGLFCAIGFIAQSIALQHASSNKVAFFISLGVLMPPLFDFIGSLVTRRKSGDDYVDEKVVSTQSRWFHSPFIPPLLAIIGASILEFTSGVDPAKPEDILLLLTPLSFAFCFYRSGQHAAVTAGLPISEDLKLQTTKFVTAVMMLTTSMLSSLYACYTGQFPLSVSRWTSLIRQITGNWKTVALLLYTGVVCTGWTAVSEQKALRVLSSGDIAMIYTLEPLFASFFGVLLLSEVITRNICIGAAFILAACLYPTLLEKLVDKRSVV